MMFSVMLLAGCLSTITIVIQPTNSTAKLRQHLMGGGGGGWGGVGGGGGEERLFLGKTARGRQINLFFGF